jgi:hypothetical protein
MNVVVHERRLRDVADRALTLAHEHFLARQLFLGRQGRIKPAQWVELGGWRKVDHVLHLRHHRQLIGSVGQMDALARGADVIAVEVGGPLLELGEVLDRAQRALGAVNLLVEHAAQAGGVEPETGRLRPHLGGLMEGTVAVEVGVAVQACHAQMLLGALAVLGLIEFLLRERREQQPQAFHLHRGDQPDHQPVEIPDGQ